MQADIVTATQLFETAKRANPYLYFELAYTRTTDWMCWVIDKQGGGRVVIAEAQGATPEEACAQVITPITNHLKQQEAKRKQSAGHK